MFRESFCFYALKLNRIDHDTRFMTYMLVMDSLPASQEYVHSMEIHNAIYQSNCYDESTEKSKFL